MGIGREVVVSSFPVTGVFRFKDEIQILPVPVGAPKDILRGKGASTPFNLNMWQAKMVLFTVSAHREGQQNFHRSKRFLEGGITQR